MSKKIVTSVAVFSIAMMLGTSAFADSKPKGYGGNGDDHKPKKPKVVPPPKPPKFVQNIIATILGFI